MDFAFAASARQIEKELNCVQFPDLLVVLGSGFGHIVQEIEIERTLDLARVSNFPLPTVPGHSSTLLIGRIGNRRVALQTGRVHLYEGFSANEVVFSIRVYQRLGLTKLLLTNAAGSVSDRFRVGEVVIIADHINLTGVSCLTGERSLVSGAFVSMHGCYSPLMRRMMHDATGMGEAVYAGLTGPSFETPAESRYLQGIGADVVGMSTVQEAICARHLGMEVGALSFITNQAGAAVSHQEVLGEAESQKQRLVTTLKSAINCGI